MTADLWCPSCRVALDRVARDAKACPRCLVRYECAGGIWLMLAVGREAFFRSFVDEYETVRSAEGRRVRDPKQLRALPFRDLSRKRSYEWAIRSRSFEALLRAVVEPLESARAKPLRVLDLGSGLGWLSYRLALRGHQVVAIDLLTNDFDGLGVHRHYDRVFTPVQAEFDRLPFAEASFDLAVYNASFHYAWDYGSTLREALRVLCVDGRVAIMDTPIYRDASSGSTMVREREQDFAKRFGFRGDALQSEGFLTYDRLSGLSTELALRWELVEPWYGLRWWMKPALARLRGLREPARFKLVVGRRFDEGR